MKRLTQIHLEHNDDIDNAVERFGDHEGMSHAKVLRWLEQFPDEELSLAIEVVRSIRYYGSANVRAMTKQLFQIVTAELQDRELARAVFVAVGRTGAGSAMVVRVLRELVRGTVHKVATMLEVAQLQPGAVDAIVFLDDFSGTGDTLTSWWETVESIVRPSNAAVFIGLLVLNEKARPKLEQFGDVLSVTELGGEANVLAEESRAFSETQKEILLERCRRTKCGPRYEKGYGECGLLVVLKHGCPNNSLPILWYESSTWRSLFSRRAI